VFALRHGLALADAGHLTAFTIIGCLALYYPIGQLADHWSKPGTVALAALVSVAASLLLSPAIGTLWALPCAILMRGAVFGAYTIAISMSGERFAGHELVASRALTAILWGAAGMIGPPLAGRAIDLGGIGLLPGILALCFVPVLATLAVQRVSRSGASR
jgi:MFS family permease